MKISYVFITEKSIALLFQIIYQQGISPILTAKIM